MPSAPVVGIPVPGPDETHLRGSHQRSDFIHQSEEQRVNYLIQLSDRGELLVNQESVPQMSKELKHIIDDTDEIRDFSGMLLE